MSTEPLKNYIKSIEALKAGDVPGAEQHLADSLGIKKLTPFMKSNLKEFVNGDDPHLAVLTIIAANMEEKRG